MPLRRCMVFLTALAALACSAIGTGATQLPTTPAYPVAAPIASGTHAPAAGPWSLAPGEYYTELTGSSFKTRSAFDDMGDRITYPGQLQEREFRSYTELGWKKRMSVVLSLPFLEHTERPSVGAPASINGLGDLGLGLKWALVNGPTAAAVSFGWEGPSGYNAHLVPAIGDGLQKLSMSLQLGGHLSHSAFWQLGAGYRYEFLAVSARKNQLVASAFYGVQTDANWADHAPVNATLAFPAGRLLVAGSYAGDIPLSSGRPFKSTSHAAGPRFTYRVDPRVDFFAGSWHTPAGKNSLHVDRFYAGIAWKSTKLNRLQGLIGSDKLP
jgi:hypothetical protein